MISVKDAIEIIKQQVKPFPKELCCFNKSYGRVLAEDIVADRDLPPFHRVAMDGIAISLDTLNFTILNYINTHFISTTRIPPCYCIVSCCPSSFL